MLRKFKRLELIIEMIRDVERNVRSLSVLRRPRCPAARLPPFTRGFMQPPTFDDNVAPGSDTTLRLREFSTLLIR
jgi:hypothetical protein